MKNFQVACVRILGIKASARALVRVKAVCVSACEKKNKSLVFLVRFYQVIFHETTGGLNTTLHDIRRPQPIAGERVRGPMTEYILTGDVGQVARGLKKFRRRQSTAGGVFERS